MSDQSDDIIIYAPAGSPTSQETGINMSLWARLEARIDEVATVTPGKAPELLSTFNRAALDLDRLGNELELEYQVAQREAERIRGEILLDRVPKILAERGLSTAKNPMGSEDMRQAVLSQEKDYQAQLETVDKLKALVKMARGKYDAFERAFRSVRTLVGEQNFNFSGKIGGGDLSGKTVGIQKPNGFGTPRY
jgi:hypothetical protein